MLCEICEKKAKLIEVKERYRYLECGLPNVTLDGGVFYRFDAFRKALTQKRLELLHVIRKEKPKSIHELARLVNRDIKNVSTDVKYLSQIGLVELKEENNRLFPSVGYQKIQFDIAV